MNGVWLPRLLRSLGEHAPRTAVTARAPEARIFIGDCREVLSILPDESVDCILSSPPYYGLRDYGTGAWEGGDPACPHKRSNARLDHTHHTTLETRGEQGRSASSAEPMRSVCRLCGAVRVGDKQIGLEETLDAYVKEIVAVFREARRALKETGTLWLNLGDSFVSTGGRRTDTGLNTGDKRSALYEAGVRPSRRVGPADTRGALKRKDKMFLPHRVAIALQDDGWWARQDNVWHKPNALPEVVRDRPATAHEYVFTFSKSSVYFYDHEAVREPVTGNAHGRGNGYHPKSDAIDAAGGRLGRMRANGSFTRAVRRVLPDNKRTLRSVWREEEGELVFDSEPDLCSVWDVPTQPFAGAHFATFPRRLARNCILAGCPPGGVVLDPFAGAFTTGVEAFANGRDFWGIELNEAFAAMGCARLGVDFEGAVRVAKIDFAKAAE